MKRQYKFTALSAVLFCLIGLLYGCTRDNEIIIPETSVNPLATDYSVAIGDEVTFTGQNMHLISKVALTIRWSTSPPSHPTVHKPR